MYAKEVKESWYGVEIPSWLRAFDCRGEALAGPYMASEKAEADLDLRSHEGGTSRGVTPVSQRTYIDARSASDEELRRQVTDMVREAEKLYAEYQAPALEDKGHGGSNLYLPLAICMSNFGWSILCDRRSSKTRFFQ